MAEPSSIEDMDPRTDWERRIGRRSILDSKAWNDSKDGALPAPAKLHAVEGVGQVTLEWQPVAGAAGYLIYRAGSPDGPYALVDHGGGDVLAVPGPKYADTTGLPGVRYWYAVAPLRAAEAPPGELSTPVQAGSQTGTAVSVRLRVRSGAAAGKLNPIWRMVGSEHLSLLYYGEGPGGRPIGEEFETALHMAHTELGAGRVRAHAIFHDELGVYREVDGVPQYDFTGIDRIYDRLLELGIRPIVELSFMPCDLASDPDATIFEYRGIISPPRDWERWGDLNRRFALHLVDRYGIDEVSRWAFEVWNEPNLEVFWSGSQAEYFRLYDVAARAIKSVDSRLSVGGPATAAAEWIEDFLDFVVRTSSPLDFLSTHTYGNLPLSVKPALMARGLGHVAVWWTEWGATPTHFAPVNDSAFGAPFVLHGMKSAQGRADALAYWVVSDHFEELGRAPRLFHGGFGLLTIGNLRKPRYWALALAEELGRDLLELELEGDGAGSLVDAWASQRQDGSIDILVWNGTLDQSKAGGEPLLDRTLEVRVEGLQAGVYAGTVARIDLEHSNITRHWDSDAAWPAPEDWVQLRSGDRLHQQALAELSPDAGTISLSLHLPMPGVARVRLIPAQGTL